MIRSLGNKIAEDIWERNSSKNLPRDLHLRAKALLTIMHTTQTLDDLRILGEPPNIRLHRLRGNLKNYWSITMKNSSPWRIICRFEKGEFFDVQIVDYH